MPESVLPNVKVLTTGGTIAAASAEGLSYQAGALPAERMLESIPQANQLARVSIEAIADVGSQDVDHEIWARLLQRVRQLLCDDAVDALVITHGTDTIEETAFLLHLATNAGKPVVLTGAMRAPYMTGADGPANLYAAIGVAASKQAGPLGVCVVMNDTVYDAVEVQKNKAEGIEAFSSRNCGPLGRVLGSALLHVYPGQRQGNPALRGRFAACGITSWPVVHILYIHAHVEPVLVEAVLATQPQGVVVAGVGNGNAGKQVWQLLKRAAKEGVAIVRATRTYGGLVLPNIEVSDNKYGFIAAGGLSPQKARILLQLALSEGLDRAATQDAFISI